MPSSAKFVITPVGTSIFDNYLKENDQKSIYIGHINSLIDLDKNGQLPEEYWANNEESLNKIIDIVIAWAITKEYPSAEIKSIIKIKDYEAYRNKPLHVSLLATDTIRSRLAAEIIKKVAIEKKNGADTTQNIWHDIKVYFDTEQDIIKGLQVIDAERFKKEGLNNLIQRIETILTDEKGVANYKNALFNITGGYKALIPFLTVIAQVYDVPVYYVFEDTEQLIEIPQLPFEFDYSYIEDNYIAFESIRPVVHTNKKPVIVKEQSVDTDEFKNAISSNLQESAKEMNLLETVGLIDLIEKTDIKNAEPYKEVKLTVTGKMLIAKYDKLFSQKTMHRGNLLNGLVELKLFEYFHQKHKDHVAIYNGFEHVHDNYNCEVDLLIELDSQVLFVEVKSVGNTRNLLKDLRKKTNNLALRDIWYKYSKKERCFRVYLYSHKSLTDKIKAEITGFASHSRDINLRWYFIKMDTSYKKGFNWKIDDDMITEIKI